MTTRTTPELPVAIIGAGFSGTLLAIHLVRAGAKVVLIERSRAMLARGLAYGTRRPEHLLNVRAANMSAFPDDPGHFLRWMGLATPGSSRPDEAAPTQANHFVPRLAYGEYLRDLLLKALAAAPDRLRIREQEAVAIAQDDAAGIAIVRLESGEQLRARAVVLALGNFPPLPTAELAGLPEGVVITNPWLPNALRLTDDTSPADTVLLLGTGLTAIDVALTLDRLGCRQRVVALSRRGLVPRTHAEAGPVVSAVARPTARGSWLLRALRIRAGEVGWRHAIDELRPHTQSLWRLHDHAAQARFLRHARAWWDVHRHRLAPPVAEAITRLCTEGRLEFLAGRIVAAEWHEGAAHITWRRRGQRGSDTLPVKRIVTCTGPEVDITCAPPPLLAQLLAEGRARPDTHHLGLDVDRLGRVIDAAGIPQPWLFAVGPITRGEAWEIVAVPDIRRQVWDMARFLTETSDELALSAMPAPHDGGADVRRDLYQEPRQAGFSD